MQRASLSLRRTNLLFECLRLRSSCIASEKYNLSSSIRLIARSLSVSRVSATPLPVLDFLHPPIVREAVKSARRGKRLTRAYHDDSKDDDENGEFAPPSQGWSEAEIRRQEELFRAHEYQGSPESSADQMMKELEAIPETSEKRDKAVADEDRRWKWRDELTRDYAPHSISPVVQRLTKILPGTRNNEIAAPTVETFYSGLSMERQAALNALLALTRGNIEGRQQQAIDIYHANDLRNYLSTGDKSIFAQYLYQSTRVPHLEELLRLFPESPVIIPTLCRLGQLDEARGRLMEKVKRNVTPIDYLEIFVLMDEYAVRGEWQSCVSFWEEVVMSPTIPTAESVRMEKATNIILERCLAAIPNAKDWFIAKATPIIMNPDSPPKMVQLIRIMGGILVRGMGQARNEHTALEVLRYMVEMLREVDQNVLFWTLRALRRSGQPKATLELYLSYRNNEFATIENVSDIDTEIGRNIKLNIQNEAMAAASLLNNFPILKQIFEDIYTLGLEPDRYSYAIVMHAFARHGQAKTVQELFDSYIRSGRQPDIYIYSEMLYVQVVLLDIPAVERTFQQIMAAKLDVGRVIYDMLTTAYTRTLDVDGAMRVFRAYIKQGNAPTVQLIGNLISMFANRNDPDAAVEMFNLLGEFGLSPNVYSFNQLLNAYASTGDRVNAEAVVSKMREVGLQPDMATWGTLLKLYVGRKELGAMVDTLARMRRAGFEPDEFSWTQVIRAFAQLGGQFAVSNVRRIMNKMRNLGIRLNIFHWNGLLEAASLNNEDLSEMQQIYDEMLDKEVKPNSWTHALLVFAYCKHGGKAGLEVAEGIMQRLTAIEDHLDLTVNMTPRTALSPRLFAPIFRAQGPNLPLAKVQEVFDDYLKSTASTGGSTAEPDLSLLTSLIDVYRRHRDVTSVKKVWNAIKSHADAASRSFRSTTENSTEFVVPGNRYLLCTPFSHYMRALADAEELDEIDLVWDQLGQEGYDFNCENWNTRIQICLLHKKHIVWAFRACEEVLMDGWEHRLRQKRKKPRNMPQHIRAKRLEKRLVNMVNRAIWPIEDDLMDLPPPMEPEPAKPELYLYRSTLNEFVLLRRELLLGTSIVDSSGRRRPGVEVWERLKMAFPRIVRAMLLHLKSLPKKKFNEVALDFERPSRDDKPYEWDRMQG